MSANNKALFLDFAKTVNLPSAQNNQQKASLFTTKLSEMVGEDKLIVSLSGNIVVNSVEVSPAAILACALEPATRKGSDVSVDSLVELWASGFCNNLQSKQAGQTPGSVGIDPGRMSSGEYLSMIFRLNTVRENADKLEAIYHRYTSGNDSTKAQLSEMLKNVFSILFPAEKREVYSEIVQREKLALIEFSALKDLGLENIAKSGESVTGFIPRSHIDSALSGLVSAGYGLTSHILKDDFSGLDVVLSKNPEKL